jgi:hypothetical protein
MSVLQSFACFVLTVIKENKTGGIGHACRTAGKSK